MYTYVHVYVYSQPQLQNGEADRKQTGLWGDSELDMQWQSLLDALDEAEKNPCHVSRRVDPRVLVEVQTQPGAAQTRGALFA